MSTWRVFTTWRGVPDPVLDLRAGSETCREHPSWPSARQDALQTACLGGARYVTVQDQADVVVGEFDAYTNRWQQYPRALVDVDHTTEVTDEPCHVVAAWCSCGWSRFVPYAPGADAHTAADTRARELTRDHEQDPSGTGRQR